MFLINFIENFDVSKQVSDLVQSQESTWKIYELESSFLPESDNIDKKKEV